MKSNQEIDDYKSLVDRFNRGNHIKYIFFWGHRSKRDGAIGKQCFSQWYPSPFSVEGVSYPSAEYFMMAEKARLFGDKDALEKILAAKNSGEAKHWGRTIRAFSDEVWKKNRFDIVVRGNKEKFLQNSELANFLANTGNRVLVEASPKDRIWGIGLSGDDPKAENPNLWKGLNLLGFALMVVRKQLRKCTEQKH